MIINAVTYAAGASGYTITTSAGSNGTITPTCTVAAGCDMTIRMTPYAGYIVANVVVDGTSIGPIMEYTFTDIAADHTVSVTFTNSYTSIGTYAALISYLSSTHTDIGVLTADMTATASIVTTASNTLDLHGHTITGTGAFGWITIENGGSLVLCDLAAGGGGKLTGFAAEYGGCIYIEGDSRSCTLIMNGGCIENCYADGECPSGGAVCIGCDCTVIMNGGSIENCYVTIDMFGGAVCVGSGSTFTMNYGRIANCYAGNSYSGGIYVYDAQFTMNGGSISGCTSVLGAGGVYIDAIATFVMNHGTIANCRSTGQSSAGGGVFVATDGAQNGRFTLNGGLIAECSAINGGGVYVKKNSEGEGIFTMAGGSIIGNTATTCGGVYGTYTKTGGQVIGNSPQE